MSQRVEPQNLHEAAASYGNTPFLLYCGSDGSARVNHVVVELTTEPPSATVTGFGRGVPRAVEAGSALSLLWPSLEPGGFSLIADGTGSFDDEDTLVIAVSGAVLHRPAPVDGRRAC